jgi:flavin reductase (DIM6/NTAB) family NADH-FMN oxidoreductase RutF
MIADDDILRQVMRRWPTGVSVVTSFWGENRHGMTVNSFASVSLHPPLIVVTLAHKTRTCSLVNQSGVFGVIILNEAQADLSDCFAGRLSEESDRFAGLEIFTMITGAPFFRGGLGYLDCRVMRTIDFPDSTLFIGEVLAVEREEEGLPLLYYNRSYRRMEP